MSTVSLPLPTGPLALPPHPRRPPDQWPARLLIVRVRRFRCLTSACPRQIFAERLPDLAAPFARRSLPLQQALERVGFALGGEAGSRLPVPRDACES